MAGLPLQRFADDGLSVLGWVAGEDVLGWAAWTVAIWFTPSHHGHTTLTPRWHHDTTRCFASGCGFLASKTGRSHHASIPTKNSNEIIENQKYNITHRDIGVWKGPWCERSHLRRKNEGGFRLCQNLPWCDRGVAGVNPVSPPHGSSGSSRIRFPTWPSPPHVPITLPARPLAPLRCAFDPRVGERTNLFLESPGATTLSRLCCPPIWLRLSPRRRTSEPVLLGLVHGAEAPPHGTRAPAAPCPSRQASRRLSILHRR
jgi:hypothetical protein